MLHPHPCGCACLQFRVWAWQRASASRLGGGKAATAGAVALCLRPRPGGAPGAPARPRAKAAAYIVQSWHWEGQINETRGDVDAASLLCSVRAKRILHKMGRFIQAYATVPALCRARGACTDLLCGGRPSHLAAAGNTYIAHVAAQYRSCRLLLGLGFAGVACGAACKARPAKKPRSVDQVNTQSNGQLRGRGQRGKVCGLHPLATAEEAAGSAAPTTLQATGRRDVPARHLRPGALN